MAAFSFRAYLAAAPMARDRIAVERLIVQTDSADRAAAGEAQQSEAPLPDPFE
jgi:hypothetical protein